MSELAKNLQELCGRVKSVSALCRELDMNRQQFARYLSGETRPSQFNLWKIADHFDVPVSSLDLPNAQFLNKFAVEGGSGEPSNLICQELSTATNSTELIRSLSGFYWAYLQSPSEPAKLLRSIVQLRFEKGQLLSTWEGQFTRAEDGSILTSRYEGLDRILNGYLFIVDIETSARDRIFEIILRVPDRRRTDILTGVTLGLTTGWHRLPFASIVVLKYLGKRIDKSAKRSQCGFFDLSSRSIESNVRNVFSHQKVAHIYPEVFERYLM